MKYAMISAVAVIGLLMADSAANAQVVIGGGFRGVGIGVGIGPGYYAPPPPVYYAPPPVAYPPGTVVAPAPVVVAAPAPVVVGPPAVSIGIGGPLFIGGYRPYGWGPHRYYRR